MERTYLFIERLSEYMNAFTALVSSVNEMMVESAVPNQTIKIKRDQFLECKKDCINLENETSFYVQRDFSKIEFEVTEEINKRNLDQQANLYCQLMDMVKEIRKRFIFSTTQPFNEYTIEFINDLDEKIAAVKYIINQRFKFLNLHEYFTKKNKIKYAPKNNKLYFELSDKTIATQKKIKDLHFHLKNKGFIIGTLTQFKAVFNLEKYDQPIIWNADEMSKNNGCDSEVLYFYWKLEESLIKVPKTYKYQILKYHFKKKDGALGNNLKQLFNSIKKGKNNPVRSSMINACFLNSGFTFLK